MTCPICDQKPMNCVCTPEERRMHAEIEALEEQEARLSFTDEEREALSWFTGGRGPVCPQYMATIRGLLTRLS